MSNLPVSLHTYIYARTQVSLKRLAYLRFFKLGMSIQARSSYLGDEILWGYRFANVLDFCDGCYRIDYSAFNRVEKVEISCASAKHQKELSKDRVTTDSSTSTQPSRDDHVPKQQPHHVRLLEIKYPQIEKAVELPATKPLTKPNYPILTPASAHPNKLAQNDGHQSMSMTPRRIP